MKQKPTQKDGPPFAGAAGYPADPKLYRVTRRIPKDDATIAMDAYYVASHVRTVIDMLALDLQDEATEVERIEQLAPIAGILPDNGAICSGEEATDGK